MSRGAFGGGGEVLVVVFAVILLGTVFVKTLEETDFGKRRCWVGVNHAACPAECRTGTDISMLPQCCCPEAMGDPTALDAGAAR